MSIFSFQRRRHSIRRLQQILGVFARHGLGHVLARANLRRYLPWKTVWSAQRKEPAQDPESLARRVTDAFQELGATFVKLGQLLSARPDIVPPEFILEFRKLQDQVEPFDSAVAFELIEKELGRPTSEVFAQIDEEPFAAGSIAQVYYARLIDGREVAVKVKRPDVAKVITRDLDLMRELAKLAERHVPELGVLRPRMLVDELAETIQRELDFVNEASNTAQFHEMFAQEQQLSAPQVHWDLTTGDMLVLERLAGANIGDFERLDRLGVSRRELAKRVADTFLFQIFERGIFHADPHPGNILVDERGRLGLVDFGMVGRLDADLKNHLAATLAAVHSRDIDVIIEIYLELGVIPTDVAVADLHHDLRTMIDKYYGLPLRLLDARKVFFEVMALARRYKIVMPREFVLLGKAFATIGGLAQALDPDINLSVVIRPYARKIMAERFSPKQLAHSASKTMWHIKGLLRTGPGNVRTLLRKAARGDLGLQLRHTGLDHLSQELDRMSNRLAFSIVTAAIIISSGVLLANQVGPTYRGLSILGVVGYVVAALFGLYLLIAILRRGRL